MELEIKVMWCKGLSSFNFFQKLTVYAAVSITSENEKPLLTQDQKQEQKTIVDEDGDGNPEWNHSMKFDLRPLKSFIPNFEDLCLLFELRNHGQLFGDKTIGEVRVPLTELIQSVGGEIVRFVSYEVRSPEGKHNGILDFSYKVIGNNTTYNSGNINSIHTITGYNHHHHGHEQEHESHGHDMNSDTHVIGHHHHHHHHHHHSKLDGNTNSNNEYHHHHLQLDGNNTNSDTHVIRYNHHSQLDGNATHNTNSDVHVMGYQHHHHSQLDGSPSILIQYPKIDLEEHLAPPLVYPPPTSSSFAANSTHYPPAPAVYPPPPPQTWADTPPPMSHYPPPQPYVYPPPTRPPPQQQPYGVPHWGYQRPPDYHHW